uniref:Uncharacterized protein n=1 Tax=Branchiostoma floridae TaxID=7739 RepID=C3YFX1_BRAFL|eukprot:XP_002604766.1 hypothetical protein BRAFLDRAFT_70615 [Branchiostoma floridae]
MTIYEPEASVIVEFVSCSYIFPSYRIMMKFELLMLALLIAAVCAEPFDDVKQPPKGPLQGPEEPADRNVRDVSASEGAWLDRNSSWVVDSAGTPWVNNGVPYDAAKTLDGDTGTYWNPLDTVQYYNNWYIVLDLTKPHTLSRIAVNNYGDNYHDIAAFKLQKSQVGSPYCWEDAMSVTNVQGGTNQRQEFDGFQGTARYWRFLITQTMSGWQPILIELELYGYSSAAAVGLWPLNAQHGASDITGNGNDGAATGTQLVPGPYGDADGAFLFSGTTNSYIEIPNNGRLDVRYSFTILVHIYPTGEYGPIFDYVGNNNWALHFWQVSAQQLYMRPVGRDGHNPPEIIADALQRNAWNYVGATYDRATGKAALWSNGELVRETHIPVAELASQYFVRVGVRDGDSRYFSGRVACLQLYDFAMNKEQVAAVRDACKKGDWLDRNSSWVVDSAGTPWVNNGVPYDAAKTLDGDTGTWWNPLDTVQYYNNWYIVLDLTEPHTLSRIAVNNYGDNYHDIVAFILQKSQVGSPYDWKNVVTVTNVQGGTNQRQEFGGFQGTARYWRFLITQTMSGWQPILIELELYGYSSVTPPPEDLRITYITETSVTASWKQRIDSLALHHKMWIRRSDTFESLFTQLVPTGQTDLTFIDLNPGTEYVISATSINRQNEGPAVNLTVGTKTDSPTALGVAQKTTSAITISWTPPQAVLIAYNITYTNENGRSTSGMTSGDVDSYELTGLVPGTLYDIDLVAVSKVGRSIAVSISDVTDTDPPSSLRATESSTVWLFLEWAPPVANILYYSLDISDEHGGDGTLLRVDGHQTFYNVTGLVPETTYVIKMASFGEHGRSVDITYSNSTVTSAGKTTKPPLIEEISRTALLQAASAVIDVLPVPDQETQVASTPGHMLESDLIDTSDTELSPKQQIKMLEEKKKEKEDMKPTVLTLGKDDYTLLISAAGCSSWKDSKKQWKLEGCDADINLDNGAISCRCHMTEGKVSVGTMTLPLPNSINFINAFRNFRNLSENPVVFSIVVSEYTLYIILMVFLCVDFHRLWISIRYRVTSRISPITEDNEGASDQRKLLPKVSLVPPERMPAPHVYQITVTTGSMFSAGTASRVGFQLYGSEGTSPVKMLNPKGEALVRGSTLHFVMPVRESLGEVMLLHIWHDNSGEGDNSSWFLGSFVVRDVEKDVVSYFNCNDWLSAEKGDGEVQKVVHASTEEELTSFTNVFIEATKNAFYDKQLWASVLVAAPGSSFTKAQRLSCCFTLLNTMMLASAMWYREENTTADTRVFNLGFVRFTIEIFVLAVALASILSLPLLAKPPTIRKEDLQLNLWNTTAPKKVHPPAKPNRQSARKNKELNEKSASVLKEILLLLVFVSLLFYIAQADKDQQKTFYETQSLSKNILQNYDVIRTPDKFYIWAEDVLLRTLYPATWYNGKDMKYLDRQFAHNTGSFRLGPPRLTQVRHLPGELGFERFIDLQTAAYWDACFKHMLGLVVFINTISLLRVVRFSKPIGKLLALPGIMKKELLAFVVSAVVAFMAFISSGFLIFGSEMESYTDLYQTTFALFEMMLGRFFAQEMLDSNPITGPIFFSTFMICIFILLVNFLMTIICDAISADVDVDHDRELADHMWRSFWTMMGFHSTPKKEDKPDDLKIEELKANICIIREVLDEGLDICNSILPPHRQEKHPKNLEEPCFLKHDPCNASYQIIQKELELETIVEEIQGSTRGTEFSRQAADTDIENVMHEYEKEEKTHQEHKLLAEVRMQTKKVENILLRVNRSTTNKTVQKVHQRIQVAAAQREKQNTTTALHNDEQRHLRNMWIPDLKLTAEDKVVLLRDEMLTDKHIHAAQMLLRRQYPGLGGLQDTAVGASVYGYTRVSGDGLQIHHTGSLHWVVSSSIGGHVSVYNSMPSKINASLEYQLCQCYAPPPNRNTGVLAVKVPRVQHQGSRYSCGLFAIAWAVDIAMGTDVTQVRYKESRMRAHLRDCFESGYLSPFPGARCITSQRPSTEHRITLAAGKGTHSVE